MLKSVSKALVAGMLAFGMQSCLVVESDPVKPTTDPVEYGNVQGRVLDSLGIPVAEAIVAIMPNSGMRDSWGCGTATVNLAKANTVACMPAPLAYDTVDAMGYFNFTGIADGKYYLNAMALGYYGQTLALEVTEGKSSPEKPVIVLAKEIRDCVDTLIMDSNGDCIPDEPPVDTTFLPCTAKIFLQCDVGYMDRCNLDYVNATGHQCVPNPEVTTCYTNAECDTTTETCMIPMGIEPAMQKTVAVVEMPGLIEPYPMPKPAPGICVPKDVEPVDPPIACKNNSGCGTDEHCMWIKTGVCPPNAECFAAESISGVCTPGAPEITMCTMEYAPVCGMDGATYSNTCAAQANGTYVSYQGECHKVVEDGLPIRLPVAQPALPY